MLEILLWTVAIWVFFLVACAYLRGYIGRRWKRVAALAAVPSVLIALAFVFYEPPIGGYNELAAGYWISRAAAEPDAAAKEALVRRVALTAPDHGWHAASEAITAVGDATQRCRLRTVLAGLPGVQNRARLGNEARDECNAILSKPAS
jgi:hypothetical protein